MINLLKGHVLYKQKGTLSHLDTQSKHYMNEV